VLALANELKGKATIFHYDVDENKDLAQQHQITHLPTLVFIKNGLEFQRISGGIPREKMISILGL
jgi:thioredoxin-like negative regulator of GroEL